LSDPSTSIEQATGTIRELASAAYSILPKVVIVLLVLAVAGVLAGITRAVLHRVLRHWERTNAIAALARIVIWLLAIAAGLSILAGDVRALLGSIGLVGLALSWALQTPIESFTGWLLNSFRAYYRIGDRIEVGEVFGDVYKIDILTTTVWEAGGPGKAVAGAQATGAIITFPNWEVLRSNIVNYSRDFPYVWDEITIGVANESDLAYTMQVFQRVTRSVLGERMTEPAARYRQLLREAKLSFDVEEEPSLYLSPADAWTNCTIRYLVPARERRRWATNLLLAISQESARSEHRGRIITAYPRTEVQIRRSESAPAAISEGDDS
jgi:small-conductance mechanosensitive channel